MIEFKGYNEIIQQWLQGVLDSYRKDAELTLKYCNKLIEYGMHNNDVKILGYAYYHLSGTYYCLNDGDKFFDTTYKALEYLELSKQWEYIARCYNVIGIIAVSRGNLPVAYDYFLNGLVYCNKYNLAMDEAIININCGCLNIQAGRYAEALIYLEKSLSFWRNQKDQPMYNSTIMCIYENVITCYVMQGKYDGVEEIFDRIMNEHWDKGDHLDKIGVLISKALFYHKSGQCKKRDECIARIDAEVSENIAFMDMVDDYFLYAKMLLECDKESEFWHILDTLDPMIRNFNITNMQLKAISLKIQFYKKHNKNAEYLQAAGLYYEISVKMEKESKEMMNNVLNLRNRLERANRERKAVEMENLILAEKSETDSLTGLANRGKLNIYADRIFNRAYEQKQRFAIEILDVDYFKEYNDNYGHQAGDQCLISVAECISDITEKYGGFCARYGGDEFVIIYENVSMENLELYAKELKEKVMNLNIPHKYSKALPIVTISQGVCCDVPEKNNKVWDFLHIADEMLYRMKKRSRNGYCVGNLSEVSVEAK